MGMSKCQKIFLYLGARHYLPQLFNVLSPVKGITDNSLVFTRKLQSQEASSSLSFDDSLSLLTSQGGLCELELLMPKEMAAATGQ